MQNNFINRIYNIDKINKEVVVSKESVYKVKADYIPIIIGLDITSIIGNKLITLFKESISGLQSITECSELKPTFAFAGIGDQYYDRYPIQMGQFSDNLINLHSWLTKFYLENGGGGNLHESYQLLWYIAMNNVKMDKSKKGIIITIGDENVHSTLDKFNLYYGGDSIAVTAKDLLKFTRTQWYVHHIHLMDNPHLDISKWGRLLGDDLHTVLNVNKIIPLIQTIVCKILVEEKTINFGINISGKITML